MGKSNMVMVEGNQAVLEYDSSIYSANVINAVAQYMIGKCRCIIGKKEGSDQVIIIELTSLDHDIKTIVDEFQEEVISYKFYEEEMSDRYEIRKMLLEAAVTELIDKGVDKNGN